MDQRFDINKLRVASPCSVDWEIMTGDERVRHCNLCTLNVYNIAGMTDGEAEDLIANRQGRLCVRLYKRSDGTVITKDCPIGLRAYQKRAAKFAGATLAAILGLFSISFGQKEDEKIIDASKIKIERTVIANEFSELTGTIVDQNGAVIPNSIVKLVLKDGKILATVSNDEGVYRFQQVSPSVKTELEVSSRYFEAVKIKNLEINPREKIIINFELNVGGETEIVGILVDSEPIIDMTSTTITTTITRRKLESLPHQD